MAALISRCLKPPQAPPKEGMLPNGSELGEAFLNTEYTEGTKRQGDTEFLKEHGNPQKQTPMCNSTKSLPKSIYSLTPVPSPNGEGREHY